ncbi:MAG: ECF-type sigma factor [Acidobacteriota bacterium]
MQDAGEISQLLVAWSDGDEGARDRLMPLVVDELRLIARRQWDQERPGHTLQPTAVVNELYMKLLGQRKVQWHNRREFFAVSSRLVRRILVDHARKRFAAKRGGGEPVLSFDESIGLPEADDPMLLRLDDALDAYAQTDSRGAQVVELHAFGGLTFDEVAETLSVGRATVLRDWKHARLWLRRALESGEDPDDSA